MALESSTVKHIDIRAATSLKERQPEKTFLSLPSKRQRAPHHRNDDPGELIEPVRSDDAIKRDAAKLLREMFVNQSMRWQFDTTGRT